jgi:hypothetical protein
MAAGTPSMAAGTPKTYAPVTMTNRNRASWPTSRYPHTHSSQALEQTPLLVMIPQYVAILQSLVPGVDGASTKEAIG